MSNQPSVYKMPASDDCMGHSTPSYYRAEGKSILNHVVFGVGDSEDSALANLEENLQRVNKVEEASKRDTSGLTYEEIYQACKNIGINLDCPGCSTAFYTGFMGEAHDENCGEKAEQDKIKHSLDFLADRVHAANSTWWHDPLTGERLNRNKGEMIALMHSELSELLEGERRDLMDNHLPHRKMAEVELADLIIRSLDYAGGFGFDLGGAFEEKMQYNAQRADHKPEARLEANGKKW